MPRFLHTADWQIGRQYRTFDDTSAAMVLAETRLHTVENLAKHAAAEQVDAVLVAGDVFDSQTVSDVTIHRLFNALRPFSGLWILMPGNHDAALAESVWTRAQRLEAVPPNVCLVLKAQVLEFPALGFALLAAPLTQRQVSVDVTQWFDSAETAPGLLRIGLAHGSVQGFLPENMDSPNPIAAERTQRARLDYLALGDWHGYKAIDARTWYSGTPETDRFRNNESGYVLRVDIPQPGALPVVTPQRIGAFVWQQWSENLQVSSDLDALIQRLLSVQSADVLQITLTGVIDLAGQQRLEQALLKAHALARSLRVDMCGLRLLPSAADVAALQADGYVGEVLAELRAEQTEQDEIAREALIILAGLLRN